jgi:hypothetical protein
VVGVAVSTVLKPTEVDVLEDEADDQRVLPLVNKSKLSEMATGKILRTPNPKTVQFERQRMDRPRLEQAVGRIHL